MSLYTDKLIAIEAPILKVWEVLTQRHFTDRWLRDFAGNGPMVHLDSNWRLGSKVVWKDDSRTVIAYGKVTGVRVPEMLHFTVINQEQGEPVKARHVENIAFELSEHGGSGKTFLRVLHGDFSHLKDGRKRHHASAETWESVLPVIKELAENE